MAATPLIVGIGGGSGCGKTYLARMVHENVGVRGTSVLSMDQYFKSVGTGANPRDVNFDHPSHLDIGLLVHHLDELKAGRAVRTPLYDFKTMTQEPEAREIQPVPVILLEGLFVLANPVRPRLDLACFLDVEPDQRLLGRLLRDIVERQHPPEEIIDRYQRFVRSSYEIFVAPTRENADVIVDFTYRRSFFTQLLIHIIGDYVSNGFNMKRFLESVRDESFSPGIRPDEGAMPRIPDLLELCKAFPE